MIEFRILPDHNPDLQQSPLLRVALLTLNYAREHGPIPLTKSRVLQRVFVRWAAEHFVWPEQGIDELLCNQKLLNEQDFLPLELLHYLLMRLRLGRQYKDQFRITKRGLALV